MTKWQPDEAGRAVIEQLRAEANTPLPGDTKSNVAKFARTFMIYSESSLSKILAVLDKDRSRSYFDDLASDEARQQLIESLAEFLKRLPRLRVEHDQSKVRVHDLSHVPAIVAAIKACKGNPTERLVKLIGPTGSGKTMTRRSLALSLAGEFPFHAVDSRDAWRPAGSEERRRCKRVVLCDFVQALGMRLPDDVSQLEPAQIENLIIDHCAKLRVLFIDEGEFFSAYALNFIKHLLNTSRLIVVLACTPRAHQKWNQYYTDEAEQLDRRTVLVVNLSKVSAEDASRFFPDKQFAQREQSLKFIAAQASQFGHLSLVQRVADVLKKSTGSEKAEVEDAVDKALRQMGRQRTVSMGGAL